MPTVATLEPARLVIPPDGTASCVLTVRNRSDIVEGYQIQVLGEGSAWAVIEPPSLRIYPGSEAQAQITFRAPRTARSLAVEVPFGVRVLPVERPADVVVPEGTLRIGAVTEMTGELLPPTAKARRKASHDIAVDNHGNTVLYADIKPTDQDDALKFVLRPARLMVPPGQAALAQLTVKHRSLQWRGVAQPKKYKVDVVAPETKPLSLEGTLIQEPIFGRWLFRLLLALLALALIAAGLWFGLVKPAVKSAAKEQAEATASEAAAAAGAGAGGGGGGGGASPSASASGGAGGAGADGTGAGGSSTGGNPLGNPVPWNATLTVEANPGAGVTRLLPFERQPPNMPARLDFLSLSGPGDTGILEIYIGNQKKFQYNLESIRQFDVHPGTALDIKANEQLSARMNCTSRAVDSQLRQLPGRCTMFIIITGTIFVPTP